jgi:hypothetical protein
MNVEEAKGSARVRLGHSELTVRPVGLGCMGMSQFYGAADDSESVETIRSAIDLGVDASMPLPPRVIASSALP